MLSVLKEKFFKFSLVILRFAVNLFLFTISFRLIEFAILAFRGLLPPTAWLNILLGISGDVAAICYYSSVLFLPFFIFFLLSESIAKFLLRIVFTFLTILQLLLSIYFLISGILLDGALYNYTLADIEYIISSAGVSITVLLICMSILSFLIYFLLGRLSLKNTSTQKVYGMFLPIALLFAALHQNIMNLSINGDYGLSIQVNKSFYFFNRTVRYYSKNKNRIDPVELKREIALYQNLHGDTNYTSTIYPLLRKNNYPDVLSPFFKISSSTKPDFVFIIVEGLGRSFSGKNAKDGSYTPFLDSLANHSLYFPNMLSTSERTLCVLPSLFGSLPYGHRGFTKLIEERKYPHHFSLLKILKENNYFSLFHYGGWAHFTNYDDFLFEQGVDYISNETGEATDFEWGISDNDLYEKSFHLMDSLKISQPRIDIYLTLSTHHPFRIPNSDYYKRLFLQRLNNSTLEQSRKETLRKYADNYASVLYADDAIRNFFKDYVKRPEYGNTIFIITGDHAMPEIPLENRNITRYNVPLIIYSPMLQASRTIMAVSSHLDIVPSLISFLQKNYNIKAPERVHWLGEGLDTSFNYKNSHQLAFMYNNTEIDDFIYGNYFLSNHTLYDISSSLENCSEVHNQKTMYELQQALENFRIINKYVCIDDKILDLHTESRFKNSSRDIFLPINTSFLFNNTDSVVKILDKFQLQNKIQHLSIQYSFNYNLINAPLKPKLCMALITKNGKTLSYKEQPFNIASQFKVSKYEYPVAGFLDFEIIESKEEDVFLSIWFINQPALKGKIENLVIRAKGN